MNKQSILQHYQKNRSILRVIACFLLLTSILITGAELRIKNTHKLMMMNTVSFFYRRARHLYENGSYLKEDHLILSGLIEKENYPPSPAYFTVASYHLTKWLHRLNFKDFTACIPLILYFMIFFFGPI